MSLTDPFVQAIVDAPYDDTPRLVFAHWLEEQSETERAELIRVQCELEPMRDLYEIERAVDLHKREDELLQEHKDTWLAIPKSWRSYFSWDNVSIEFRRGFPDLFLIPARTFLEIGSKVLKRYPTIRRLVLFRVHGYGHRLSECKALQHVPELELACWYSDQDAKAIAASPHLSQLQVLEIWLGRQRGLQNSRLCRIMGASQAWPQLRELTILNPNGEKEKSRKRLAKLANQVAGRDVAVYRRGYPELFPFAADFWYTFPGYLPDGRMAMAAEDHTTDPPSLCVITFNKKGRQTKDILYVPLPDELLEIPTDEWFRHKDWMQNQLIEEIGFRPGFIRIRDCKFPGDEWGADYPHQGHGDYWDEQFGDLDTDDEESWEAYPRGIGGQIYWLLRDGEFEFGWDRWADKRGRVHST